MPNILKNASLKPFNTFGLEAKAKLLVAIKSIDEAIKLTHDEAFKANEKMVLGGGSNLLLTKDFDGLVIKNEIKGIKIIKETETDIYLKVGGGEIWHEFVLFCVTNNYCGLENLSLIPGTVGAAPMQNIGAYGVEIKDVFEELEALNWETQKLERFDNSQCQFGYRESIFKHSHKGKYLICNVTFKLSKKPKLKMEYGAIRETLALNGVKEPSIKDISDAVIAIRQSKLPDPAEIGNSGSFFKNPVITKKLFAKIKDQYDSVPSYPIDESNVKVPAGWLIEQAGWKGYRQGEIGVHQKQALVLVNYGDGIGKDIENLAYKIINSVQEKFGVQLQPEVNII
ncbi:UDP-N-acetylmuramate dehydrogenase [Jiulongibacter sp. NS-SX5]|uniref:UDP-N-acetylmuramate dehydrogenase n=1 Tax=Jiulongibacter sp. NS-SX5 TaxID=3463854 RepID=UPI0040591981